MNESQIFISHDSADIKYAERLYDDLISARFWVWMDKKNLRAAEKWELQIDENLRKSRTFIVLFSSKSIASEWVKHEGSMAFALSQVIIPVNIERSRSYSSKALPIWARPLQLLDLFEGSAEYADQLQKLKQLLGEPLSIRKHLLEMLDHYKRDKVLLDEVALDLVLRHYDELHLTKDEKAIADELIEQSMFRLESYWTRYEKLNEAYKKTRTEKLTLKQMVENFESKIRFYLILAVFCFVVLVFYILVVVYVFLRITIPI